MSWIVMDLVFVILLILSSIFYVTEIWKPTKASVVWLSVLLVLAQLTITLQDVANYLTN
jgi:hypothetical protein